MRKYLFFTLFLLSGSLLYSQQIVRIGVLDYSKVISSLSSGDSRALQEIDRLVKSYEEGLDNIRKDIASLEEKKLYFASQGDDFNALKMEEQITKKREYMNEYSRVRLQNIEDRKKRIMLSPEFLVQILREIEYIAESEGFSMVLNSRDPNLIWWSQSVDITDLVIKRLAPKN
ncbi:MAG: OmpH family outer membrane protein [Spirochaetaceae bacterium]|nr:OmpH family outer membrane protein [Spirochaetaceae bacterium]